MNILATSTTLSPRSTRIPKLGALALAAVLVSACGAGSSSRGELGENQEILASCDPAAPPASLVQLDGTGSSASDAITTERMDAVQAVARKTAVCSGRLKVLAFSSSSAATTVLFDGDLRQPGATDNARLKKVPEAVAAVMNTVRTRYGPAVKALPQGGSDIASQLRLAAEWTSQLGGSYRLRLVVLTDGLENVRADLSSRALSKQEAIVLADQAVVPKLAGAEVVVAGLGRVAEGAPPSALAEGLVAYYTRLCERTEAASCASVSDYATAGR